MQSIYAKRVTEGFTLASRSTGVRRNHILMFLGIPGAV